MKIVISNLGQSSNPFLEHIRLIHGDVTAQEVDALAMIMPQSLEMRGSINESICEKVGYDLDEFILDNIYKPRIGDVYALPGGDLPVKHILLGIMPKYRTDFDRVDSDVSSVMRKIMELARCMLLTSIAVPPLASGRNGFPRAKAARLVSQGIAERMQESFEDVRIVCDDAEMIDIFKRKLKTFGWEGE